MIDDPRRTDLTDLALQALDTLETESPDARLGDAILLFEVIDDEGASTVWQKASTDRATVCAGLCGIGFAMNVDDQ